MAYIEIYADANRGIYIPQHFAQSVMQERLSGVSDADLQTLINGPDDEWYWEAWQTVLDNARMTDNAGHVWSLYQDGDLFMIRDDCPDHERAALIGE